MMDVRVGNDRRKQLLQQLFQQFSGMMQRGGGQPNLAPGMRPLSATQNFFAGSAGGRGAFPSFTHPDQMPAGLEHQLGPGGYGTGTAFDQGGGDNAPVPHAPPPHPAPPATAPGVPQVFTPPAPPPHLNSAGSLPQDPGAVPSGSGDPNLVALPNPRPAAPSGLVPLGNGMYWDPAMNIVHGLPVNSTSGHGGV